ncbi:hypothetical protein PENTCL1PPCAC_27918, partial [Pristionchus entomophagus]
SEIHPMSLLLSSTLRPFVAIQEEDELPSVVLATLVVLLLLLAALIWVAFCMAVHRTARRMAIFKRQRRTQSIIAAAISRAVFDGGRPPDNSPSTFSLFTAHAGPSAALPTYEQALAMEPAPLSIAVISSAPHLSSGLANPPAYNREIKSNRVVRIAPERPGVSSNLCPPSYEYSTRPSSSRTRVYTLPSTVADV